MTSSCCIGWHSSNMLFSLMFFKYTEYNPTSQPFCLLFPFVKNALLLKEVRAWSSLPSGLWSNAASLGSHPWVFISKITSPPPNSPPYPLLYFCFWFLLLPDVLFMVCNLYSRDFVQFCNLAHRRQKNMIFKGTGFKGRQIMFQNPSSAS